MNRQGPRQREKEVVRQLCRQAETVIVFRLADGPLEQFRPGERDLKVREHAGAPCKLSAVRCIIAFEVAGRRRLHDSVIGSYRRSRPRHC
jgi:hypothetical protein